MKKTLTPGRLYALLAGEFRQVCCERCRLCSLPEPVPVEDPGPGEPTWVLGTVSRACEPCQEEIAAIVRRNQAAYDLLDPVSPPLRFRAQVRAWRRSQGRHVRH